MKDKEFELASEKFQKRKQKNIKTFTRKDLENAYLQGRMDSLDTNSFEEWFNENYKNGTG